MKKKDFSKPKPVIPPFDGPAHYARLAAMRQEQPAAQSIVIDLDGERYELTLPAVITLKKVGGVVDPPIGPVEPTKGYRMGTNTHHWMPLPLLEMFDSIRLYVATGWIWRPGGLFVQPFFQAETANMHGLDDYLTAAKASGKDVLLCTNLCPDWYNGYDSQGYGSNPYPPIKNLATDKLRERAAASSYQDYADYFFQLVARYGKVKHPDSLLRVDTTPRWDNDQPNEKKSGLGLLTRIEIGNEVDRWWSTGEDYMEPEEHAAMLWACYAACKKADPEIKVIMAGLTGADVPYLKRMKAYYDKNGVKFMSDAINIHYYTHEGNDARWPPTWWNSGACYPEEDKGFYRVEDVVKFGESLTPPLETILSEFGCDSRPPSWMHIKGSKYGLTDEEAQGQLIAKSFAAHKKAGVKESMQFIAADEEGTGLWQSCGIVTSQSKGYQKKQSFDVVKKATSELSNT